MFEHLNLMKAPWIIALVGGFACEALGDSCCISDSLEASVAESRRLSEDSCCSANSGYEELPSLSDITKYRVAARNGDLDSMRALGLIYQDGWGLERDIKRATHWLNLAAQKGDGISALYLSQIYLAGKDPDRHRTLAFVWALFALSKSVDGVKDVLAKLRTQMSNEEIEESVKILNLFCQKNPEMMGG